MFKHEKAEFTCCSDSIYNESRESSMGLLERKLVCSALHGFLLNPRLVLG